MKQNEEEIKKFIEITVDVLKKCNKDSKEFNDIVELSILSAIVLGQTFENMRNITNQHVLN